MDSLRRWREEVQAACAGDVEQVSRVCGVSRVQRAAAAGRSEGGADKRPEYLPGAALTIAKAKDFLRG